MAPKKPTPNFVGTITQPTATPQAAEEAKVGKLTFSVDQTTIYKAECLKFRTHRVETGEFLQEAIDNVAKSLNIFSVIAVNLLSGKVAMIFHEDGTSEVVV